MQDNGMVIKFQSAYIFNHSTETALLRVLNDMLFFIDQGRGGTLVLLDLSGVPQGFVLSLLNFCAYMYPIASILRHHGIDYYICQ